LISSDGAWATNAIASKLGGENITIVKGNPKHVALHNVDQTDMEKLVFDNWLLSKEFSWEIVLNFFIR
jgi:hypothetical protein